MKSRISILLISIGLILVAFTSKTNAVDCIDADLEFGEIACSTNTTLDMPPLSSVNYTINAGTASVLNLYVVTKLCKNLSACQFNLLLLGDDDFKLWSKGKYLAITNNVTAFVNVNSVSISLLFPQTQTYHLIIASAVQYDVDLQFDVSYQTSATCYAAIASAMGAGGLLLLVMGGCYFFCRRSKTSQHDEERTTAVEIPSEQLASPEYFDQPRFRIAFCSNNKMLSKFLTQPHTKYLYWLRQNWRVTGPWYPEWDEVLTTYDLITGQLTLLAFTFLFQLLWAPSIESDITVADSGTLGFASGLTNWGIRIAVTTGVQFVVELLYFPAMRFTKRGGSLFGKKFERDEKGQYKNMLARWADKIFAFLLALLLICIIVYLWSILNTYTCKAFILQVLSFIIVQLVFDLTKGLFVKTFQYYLFANCGSPFHAESESSKPLLRNEDE